MNSIGQSYGPGLPGTFPVPYGGKQNIPRAGSFLDAVAQNNRTEAPGSTETVKETSLESMLKAKYPGLAYHVFDAGSSYWRTRND